VIIPVILSGGAGTRLWPLSRELYPKQLLPLCSEHTMLQETLGRLQGVSDLGATIVVCNEHHRFMVAEQLRLMAAQPSSIILEPVGRNTAPAVAVAAFEAMKQGQDPLLLVLPADHVIQHPAILCEIINKMAVFADQGNLLTFGIVPDHPETGYGYIRRGQLVDNADADAGPYHVGAFVEKPNSETAAAYLASGEYLWNSGMFLFKASAYLEELKKLAPQMLDSCRIAWQNAHKDLDFLRLGVEEFSACPSDSIDYAVMEKTSTALVALLAAGWNDVGSWSALWEVGAKDEHGNICKGDVLTHDSDNCYLHAESRLLATVGLKDHVVVETRDAVLVAAKGQVQNVKEIVAQLKARQRGEALLHRCVNRPWGTYECIDQAERFQVKRITVKPGGTLSLQKHHHRAEHWVVVKGTALITKGDETLMLSENQSTYIPLGVVHRLQNPGKIPLEIIEVQSGSYLGEDDIVRIEDDYGR